MFTLNTWNVAIQEHKQNYYSNISIGFKISGCFVGYLGVSPVFKQSLANGN